MKAWPTFSVGTTRSMSISNSNVQSVVKLALLLTMKAASAQAGSPETSRLLEDFVSQRDQHLNALISHHEAERARDFYDDQFVLTTSSGKTKGKADLLNEIGSSDVELDVNETSDVVVRVRNETAVLTATLHQRGTYKGKAFDAQLRVTDTWVFVDGAWRILAGHASKN